VAPDFVPLPREVVLATGVREIAGALALLSTQLRRLVGVMLALYAVCVFPAIIDWPWQRRAFRSPRRAINRPL
jgi:uncharacterized membrane protein